MSNRVDGITHRGGDKGTTVLSEGFRVEKDSPRILMIGAIDELNSHVGFVLSHQTPPEVRDCLLDVQHRLVDVTVQLRARGERKISEEDVLALERDIKRFVAGEQTVREVVLPGGSLGAAACYMARAVCRRTESQVVAMIASDPDDNALLIAWFNRLSDLLFVLARVLNEAAHCDESVWPGARTVKSP